MRKREREREQRERILTVFNEIVVKLFLVVSAGNDNQTHCHCATMEISSRP